MVATAVRAIQKFVLIDKELEDIAVQKDMAKTAFANQKSDSIELEDFHSWFTNSDVPQSLQAFVDARLAADAGSAGGTAPAEVAAPVRKEMQLHDYRAVELFQELERLSA